MTVDRLPLIMVRCLLLTILFENGLAFILGVRNKKDQLFMLLVNVMTNPIAVISMLLVNIFTPYAFTLAYRYCAEIAVFAAEGLVYKKTLGYKKINPFLLSLMLNAFSFFTGEVLNKIFY